MAVFTPKNFGACKLHDSIRQNNLSNIPPRMMDHGTEVPQWAPEAADIETSSCPPTPKMLKQFYIVNNFVEFQHVHRVVMWNAAKQQK